VGQPSLSIDLMKEAWLAYRKHQLNKSAASRALGLAQKTYKDRLERAEAWLATAEGKAWEASLPEPTVEAPAVITKPLHDQIKALQKQLKETETESITTEQVRKFLFGLAEYTPEAPDWCRTPKDPTGSHGIPTLMLSDLHWGEVVFLEQVFNANAFNLNIAAKRMKKTTETTLHLTHDVLAKPMFEGLVLVLGGDMICGDIHEELKQTSEKPIMPQVLDCADNVHQAIRLFLKEFPKIFVPCVAGNHGRTTRKPQMKFYAETNFDWLIYQMLERFTQDVRDRVTFMAPPARDLTFRVAGRRYRLSHGDQFRGGDGVIGALGPVTRGDKKKRSMASTLPTDREQYDTLMIGHWHQCRFHEGLIMNGSMKGYDEFAMSNNFDFEPARQALWFTHPKYGINHHLPVLCDEPKGVTKKEWVAI
jgi:hypothetical protein